MIILIEAEDLKAATIGELKGGNLSIHTRHFLLCLEPLAAKRLLRLVKKAMERAAA